MTPPLWNFSKNSSDLVAGPFPNLGISNRINISIAIKYQVLSILKSHSHIDQVLLGILPYLLSSRVGGYRSVVNILAKRGVRPSHKVQPIFPVDTNFRTLPESSPSFSSVVLYFVIICSQNGSFFRLKKSNKLELIF